MPDTSTPGTIAVPLALAFSIGAACFSAGGAYFTITRSAIEVEALRARVDDHVHTPAHAVTAERLLVIDARLAKIEGAIAEQRATREEIVKIGQNVRALCAASKAANCAP